MSARARIGVELNPHLIGGTEHFLRRLFGAIDRERVEIVALAAAPGAWQALLDGVAETHVVPYLIADGVPADVASELRALRVDLLQSSYFSPVLALAAAQLGLPHLWRFGGHVTVLDREPAAGARLLAIATMTSRRIVCASQFLRSQRARIGPDLVEVIPNGIDLPAAAPAATGGRPRTVAMVAHLVPKKRHHVFLRAAHRLAARRPDLRFAIYGGTYPTAEMQRYAGSVRALITTLGLDARVEQRELRADRDAALRAVDVFAFTAVDEGASNALLEAMAVGRPVVAVDSGSNAELVEDGVTGIIVPPDDPDALAGALEALLGDPARCATMGAAARRRAERLYDIRDCARRYEALYEAVLSGTPSGAGW
jgi:glycosyltransferase involved in cell wall biosynthesis